MKTALLIVAIIACTLLCVSAEVKVAWAQGLEDSANKEEICAAVDWLYFVSDAIWKFVLCGCMLIFFRPTNHRNWAALFSFLTSVTFGYLLTQLLSSTPWEFNPSAYIWAGIGAITAVLEYLNIHLLSHLYTYLQKCLKQEP